MSEASREVFWPEGTARLASLADIYIFFLFDPVFCLFPQLRSLVPGYMVTIDFKVGEIKKLESSEAYLLNLGKNLSWAFEVTYIFCKNAV